MTPIRLPISSHPPRYEATIPLINVAFLLMAFFMLIGRMDATGPFDLMPPRSDVLAPLPHGGVTISMSEHGDLALDGAPATAAEVLEAVATRKGDLVRLNVNAATRLADFLPLIAALESAGVPRAVLVVTPPAPEPP